MRFIFILILHNYLPAHNERSRKKLDQLYFIAYLAFPEKLFWLTMYRYKRQPDKRLFAVSPDHQKVSDIFLRYASFSNDGLAGLIL